MKKPLLIFIIILVVILALPVISLIQWTFQSKKPMDILLVDKTVPNLEREKHKSFNWVLTNERFVKKEKKTSYSYRTDYIGFVPKRPLTEKKYEVNRIDLDDIIIISDSIDAIYFADTYGVFFNDWYQGLNKSRRSRLLYGGLYNTDYLLINEMEKRNKLIILEYNSFDYPTAKYESFRTQEKLGLTFSGWTGKYFSSLDTTSSEFPIWMTAMYRKQYNKPWSFSESGIVLLREKDIIVLEEGTHLTNGMPHIITDEINCAKFGLPASVAFDQWFDIIDPLENNIISKFKFETTPIADSLLLEYNLSSEFPAAIQDSGEGRTYYFSGDFTSTGIPVWTSRFKGFNKLKTILYSDKPDDPRRFFWLYYRPLINGIFSDYYSSMNSE